MIGSSQCQRRILRDSALTDLILSGPRNAQRIMWKFMMGSLDIVEVKEDSVVRQFQRMFSQPAGTCTCDLDLTRSIHFMKDSRLHSQQRKNQVSGKRSPG